jgi:F-type H+-transporting ATPase subunit b
LMQAAEEEEKAIIGKINESAQAELRDVKAKIAEEMGTVKATLEEEIDAFADAIGQKILGRVA